MGNWTTYRLEDFVPVTPQVYWRLLERINEAFWPLHILAVALGAGALLLAVGGNRRIALCLLAPAWLSSGVIFHRVYYAELNWAAPWFGWAFIAQAAVLLGIGMFGGTSSPAQPSGRAAAWIGTVIAVGALLFYPLLAVALGAGPTHAEVYGLHPDPTAIATLGVLPMAVRGVVGGLAFVIPFLWCWIASLTLVPLDAAWGWLPATVAVFAAALFIAAHRSARRNDVHGGTGPVNGDSPS